MVEGVSNAGRGEGHFPAGEIRRGPGRRVTISLPLTLPVVRCFFGARQEGSTWESNPIPFPGDALSPPSCGEVLVLILALKIQM